MIKIWLKFLSNKRNFNISIITILLFGAISLFFSWFLVWVENRDPYLGEFIDPLFFWDPIDLSTPTFFLTYGIIGFYILHHISSPLKIVYFIQMLIFIVACRIVSLTLIQFDAPEVVWSTAQAANIEGQTLIQLADPILNNIIYHQDTAIPNKPIYTHHDLFFSGHTAKCLLASLLYENKKMRYLFIILTCVMATFLLLQHVHYSIDIFFAPVVTFCAIFLHNKLIKSKQTL
tara:strand:- start:153 stop:848 length:696 start_codon:yes stop_codon:yes gene_type:complete